MTTSPGSPLYCIYYIIKTFIMRHLLKQAIFIIFLLYNFPPLLYLKGTNRSLHYILVRLES